MERLSVIRPSHSAAETDRPTRVLKHLRWKQSITEVGGSVQIENGIDERLLHSGLCPIYFFYTKVTRLGGGGGGGGGEKKKKEREREREKKSNPKKPTTTTTTTTTTTKGERRRRLKRKAFQFLQMAAA